MCTQGRGVLNVEILLEFGNSFIVLVSLLFPSCQWHSPLKANVVGHSEEGA